MADEKEAPQVDELAELKKSFETFIVRYEKDMQFLNRILSTYEDKLSTLENRQYDFSYNLKQLVASQSKE